jgi:hypothetical protein
MRPKRTVTCAARLGAFQQGPAVYSETGVKTGQESRSTGHSAAFTMTTMDLSTHMTPRPHTGPEASLAFYRDALGFEVRKDVGAGSC